MRVMASIMRRPAVSFALATVLAAAALVPALDATAAVAAPGATNSRETPEMVDVDPSDFAAEAAELSAGLKAAIERDTEFTPAEYLAHAEAAGVAADVVTSLRESIEVRDARIEGTELVVWVRSAADARRAESVGARAIVGEPPVVDISGIDFEPVVDLRGGAPYFYDSYRCSIGFPGVEPATSARQVLTAGHCLGTPTSARVLGEMTAPNGTRNEVASIGLPVSGSYRAGGGWDHGLISVTNSAVLSRPEVLTWGGSNQGPLSSAPVVVRDVTPPITGATLCKSGSTTGWTCGVVKYFVEDLVIGSGASSYTADGSIVCITVRQGDSGGPALIGSTAIGITSATGSTSDALCGTSPSYVGFFVPLVSPYPGAESARTLYGGSWEPLVAVNAPVLSTPAPNVGRFTGTTISGKVDQGGVRHRVEVSIDGGPARTVPVSSTGAWSLAIGDLAPGTHTYRLIGKWGQSSASASAPRSGYWIDAAVERLAGPDRYVAAVSISKKAFPGTVDTVFVATGVTYPDALAAGPVAAEVGGPLLLTTPTVIPDSVKAELRRLKPRQIVVVGGLQVLSPSVQAQLAAFASDPRQPVVRVNGANRYETSRLISARAFPSAAHAYVATGDNYADALTASSAAAAEGVPVILVPGRASSADAATLDYLRRLGVTRIFIAGGTPTVSTGMEASLNTVAPVTRLGGPDRFAASLSINDRAYDSATQAFLAYGYNFPDALAGSVLAGRAGGPMYITQRDCVPSAILNHLAQLGIAKVTIFGGPPSVGVAVENLARC